MFKDTSSPLPLPTNTTIVLSNLVHDLIQPLTVIQAEVDLLTMQDDSTNTEALLRLNRAIGEMTDRLRQYQKHGIFEVGSFPPKSGINEPLI